MKNTVETLKVKLFADGADHKGMVAMAREPWIRGFTTNPTLMRKAGVKDYREFGKSILKEIRDKPVCFEVISDDFAEMERQARDLATWGPNVYVKIPVKNTQGEFAGELIHTLSRDGVKINATAVFSLKDVVRLTQALRGGAPSMISIFAGRIADAGLDPVPIVRAAVEIVSTSPSCEVVWASPREVLNVVQANDTGCHIITMTQDLLKKLSLIGTTMDAFCLDTVKMFYNDAQAAQFSL